METMMEKYNQVRKLYEKHGTNNMFLDSLYVACDVPILRSDTTLQKVCSVLSPFITSPNSGFYVYRIDIQVNESMFEALFHGRDYFRRPLEQPLTAVAEYPNAKIMTVMRHALEHGWSAHLERDHVTIHPPK